MNFLRAYSRFALLNNSFVSNESVTALKSFDFLVGIAGINGRSIDQLEEIDALLNIAKKENQTVFGHITYGLKDQIEKPDSRHADLFNWPVINFFIPEIVIKVFGNEISIEASDEKTCDELFQSLLSSSNLINTIGESENTVAVQPAIKKENYLDKIESIKKHIHRGDIYEMNYCMEMKAENISIDPYFVYHQVCMQSPAPFSCLHRYNNNFLLCSSPERFIKRTGDKIISQPIKGTARRGKTVVEDNKIKDELFKSEKERSENVMIVDLVRNDLSRIAKRGTVKVDELFGIYSFPTVHQMISTVAAEVKEDVLFSDIIRSLFPMGSMTGAPKISAMQLIDRFEDFNRGLYSGCIGYIAPNGDFDFNVVIRSIIFNQALKKLTIPVGSAITAASDASSEYDECLLKAQGLLKSLGISPETISST